MTTTSTTLTVPALGRELARAVADRGVLRAIGAASAPAAHVAVLAGFDALWVSGLEVSAALGLPDENVLSVRDLTDVVLAVNRAAALPVIVDIDNAGGSTATAKRFGGDLARAGAAALCVEDSAYPKINSFALHRHQQLADPELMCEQLGALREAAGPAVALIARTEALICGMSIPEAVNRAAAYASAGADAVLIHSKDPSGIQALDSAAMWNGPVPLVTVPTAFPQLGPSELGEAGFALAIYANQLSRVSLAAMRAAATAFATAGSFTSPGCPPLADVQDLLRVGDLSARACL